MCCSLCVSWQRAGLSGSTRQVSTQLGGDLEAKVRRRRRRRVCHLECGLTRKPAVSKVQVEPSRGSRVCASGGGAPDFPAVSWGFAGRSPGPWLCPPALRVPSTSEASGRSVENVPARADRPALLREGTLLVLVRGDGEGRADPGVAGGRGPAPEKAGVGPCGLPNPRSSGRGQAPCVSAFRGLHPPAAGTGGRAAVHPGASDP